MVQSGKGLLKKFDRRVMSKPLVHKISSALVKDPFGAKLTLDQYKGNLEKLIPYFLPEKMKKYTYTPFYDGLSFDPIKDHFNKSQLECRKFIRLLMDVAQDESIIPFVESIKRIHGEQSISSTKGQSDL